MSYWTNIGLAHYMSVGGRNGPPLPSQATRAFDPQVDLESASFWLVLVKEGWGGFSTPDPTIRYVSALGTNVLNPAGATGYTGNAIPWDWDDWDVTIDDGLNQASIVPRTPPILTMGASFASANVVGCVLCTHNDTVTANKSVALAFLELTQTFTLGANVRFSLTGIDGKLQFQ